MFVNATKSPIPLWILNCSWNKGTFSSGEQANGYFLIQNISGRPIFIKTLRLRFDWNPKVFDFPCSFHIPPNSQSSTILLPIKIPSNITGRRTVHCSLETLAYRSETQRWVNYGFVSPKDALLLYIKPEPIHSAFISRSNWEQDKPLIDPIVKRTSEWGFDCYTVGINVKAKDPNKPTPEIKREISQADCLIAIATPRDLLVKHGQWTAPEWLHGEVGIGFGKDKPILVIYEESIKLSGLPAQFYHIPFSMYDLPQLMPKIDAVMPYVRKWIEKQKWDALWTNIFKGIAVGVVGYGIYKAGEEEGRRKG